MAVRFPRALLTNIVDKRRKVTLDFCQQLRGRESWIGVELAIEDSVSGVEVFKSPSDDVSSACYENGAVALD